MTDPLRPPGSRAGSQSDAGGRRWVRVAGIAVGILLLLAVVVLLMDGGEHRPGRHASGHGDRPSVALAHPAAGT